MPKQERIVRESFPLLSLLNRGLRCVSFLSKKLSCAVMFTLNPKNKPHVNLLSLNLFGHNFQFYVFGTPSRSSSFEFGLALNVTLARKYAITLICPGRSPFHEICLLEYLNVSKCS